MPYAALHVRKLSSVGGIHAHVHRVGGALDRMGERADPQWTPRNRLLMGTDRTAARINEIIEALPNQRRAPRKDAVRAVEIVLSASPELFYDFAKAGITKAQWETTGYRDPGYHDMLKRAKATLDEAALKKWTDDTVRWLREQIGEDKIVSATLHLDEKTPHVHVIAVPVVGGRLSCKAFFTREACRKWQDSYAQCTGLQRGQSSEKRHDEQADYEITVAVRKAYAKAYKKGYSVGLNEAMSLSPVKWVRAAIAEWHKPTAEVVEKVRREAEQKIAALTEKVEELESSLRGSEANREAAERRARQLSADLRQALARAEKAEKTLESLQSRLEMVEARAVQAERDLARLIAPVAAEDRRQQAYQGPTL